jgi:transcriptional regulator with XRE-family HTH domain
MGNFKKIGRDFIKERYPELNEVLFDSMAAIFGDLISANRMSKGLSQDELASIAGMSQKTISRVEGGSSNVTMDTYQKLFRTLKISNEEVAEALKKKAKRGIKPLVTVMC